LKKLVIINGTMGVGKSTICKELSKRLENSVWLDGDWCWMMNPLICSEAVLKERMLKDSRSTESIELSLGRLRLYETMDT